MKKKPAVRFKSDHEIEAIRASGSLAAATLRKVAEHVLVGVNTLELNDICHRFIVDHGAIPAPLNYRGFPKSVCTSVNEVICHGIPDARQELRDGDIINIDVTTIVDGYHGDCSRTFIVGSSANSEARRVVQCAYDCLYRGIGAVRVGGHVGDIGAAIVDCADGYGFSVVRDFVGHGIGRDFHEAPQIPHFGKVGQGLELQAGMVFTIEPMINVGTWKAQILEDKWTAVTRDGKLSAQFEHTVAIANNGRVEILTEEKIGQ